MKTDQSPYLTNRRLSDIIAAIQQMGSYKWSTLKVEDWKERLEEPLSARDWSIVFIEHPEFFRLNEGYASLRWRYAYDVHDIDDRKVLSTEDVKKLPHEKRLNLTRNPLTADQIETLLNTAIELHSRAIALKQERRWWIPILTSLLGVIVGALLGGLLKA